jgi:hypothetical protein
MSSRIFSGIFAVGKLCRDVENSIERLHGQPAFTVGEEMVLKKKSSQNLASGDGGVFQAFFTRANGLASTLRLASPSSFINITHLSSTATGSQVIGALPRKRRYVLATYLLVPAVIFKTFVS